MPKKSKNKSSIKTLAIAIVIIGIAIVVIGVLWLMNLFQPGCHSYSNFSCSIVSYNYSTGNVTLLIGQNTGSAWYNVQAVYEAGDNGIQNVTLNQNTSSDLSGVTLRSGYTTEATFNLGTNTMGSIWEIYTNSSGTIHYARKGELILRQ